MRQFYLAYQKRYTLCSELIWSHYRILMRISDDNRRAWYTEECAKSGWSVRQLERQINTMFYERLLSSKERTLLLPKSRQQSQSLNTKKLSVTPMFWNSSTFPKILIFMKRIWNRLLSTTCRNFCLNSAGVSASLQGRRKSPLTDAISTLTLCSTTTF